MSLLNFPPPSSFKHSFSLQEFNGQIITGGKKEYELLQKSSFLSGYPQLERSGLSRLQHSLSRDDVKGAVFFRHNNSSKVKEEASTSEDSSWPLGRAVLRMRNGLNLFVGKISMDPTETVVSRLQEFANTRNWKSAWLRCIAADRTGSRLAVCQTTDYIRVYCLDEDSQPTPPLTLHHSLQKNVAAMHFDPQDSRILAVAASSNVIVWRLAGKMGSTRSSATCIRVVDTGVSPLSSLSWDSSSGSAVITSSPSSNKLFMVDLTTGEMSSMGAWLGGSVTGLYPSRDATRIAVTYTGSVIRVYERETWREEKWAGLEGRATGIVWSPTGESLIFSTHDCSSLFALSFTSKTRTTDEGVRKTVWIGDSRARIVYDLSPIQFDPSENAKEIDLEEGNLGPMVRLGGPPSKLAVSEDGERLAVTFIHPDSAKYIALFILDWTLPVQLLPCGFVEASFMGIPEIVTFLPNFAAGSLLAISWSGGTLQYLPLIYGKNPVALALSARPLFESHSVSCIPEESLWAGGDSLASVELTGRLAGSEDSALSFSEILKETSMHHQLL